MEIKRKKISLEDAARLAENFSGALIYCSTGIEAGFCREIKKEIYESAFTQNAYDTGSVLEARLFSDSQELHIFRREGEICCILTKLESGDYIDTEYLMADRFGKGRMIRVRRYLKQDEDGQACIMQTCLAGIGGAD